MEAVNAFLANPGSYHPLLSVIKGVRNGAVYGAKIRAPHALVMTFLFKSGSLNSKLRAIFQATVQHSRNLASFVFIYKSAMAILKQLAEKKEKSHPFVAAFLGGYLVFGENNRLNQQIVMYLFSRVVFAAAKLGAEKGYYHAPSGDPWPWFAALVWGAVLWLFEFERHTLQDSLRSSMVYLYDDSEKWTSLWNFLWHNK